MKKICFVEMTNSWEEVCDDHPVERTEYYYEPVQKIVNR